MKAQGRILTVIAAFLLALPAAQAKRVMDDESTSSRPGFDFTGVKATAYSAACRYDRHGGPNASPSTLKPRSYTLESGSPIVMVAVPQSRGTKSLVGCFLELDLSQSTVPKSMRPLFQNKKFFAGDHYGTGSNGMKKIDISYDCRPGLNNKTFKGIRIKKGRCVTNWRKGSNTRMAVAEESRKIQIAKANPGAGPASVDPQPGIGVSSTRREPPKQVSRPAPAPAPKAKPKTRVAFSGFWLPPPANR